MFLKLILIYFCLNNIIYIYTINLSDLLYKLFKMPDKKEIKENPKLNDEKLENVAGGDGKVYYIFKNERKKGKTSYDILNEKGQVLFNLPTEESAKDLANKLYGEHNEIKSIDFESIIRLLKESENKTYGLMKKPFPKMPRFPESFK